MKTTTIVSLEEQVLRRNQLAALSLGLGLAKSSPYCTPSLQFCVLFLCSSLMFLNNIIAMKKLNILFLFVV